MFKLSNAHIMKYSVKRNKKRNRIKERQAKENQRETYFFRNFFSHIEHSNNCSLCGDDELFWFSRFTAVDGFFGVTFFK